MNTAFKPRMRAPLQGASELLPPSTGQIWRAVLVSLLLLGSGTLACAERATPAEAKAAAQGWVRLIERVKGHWGAAIRPEVGQVVALQASNRVIGYYCPVSPSGYVLLASHKELNPVRSYSVRGGLDPQEARGPSGLMRGILDGILNQLEQSIGPLDTARPEKFQAVLKRDYRPAWKKLQNAASNPAGISPKDATYQSGGGVLLSTMWAQGCPYNLYCPSDNCTQWCNLTSYNANDLVGCVPLSAAEIMRHWSWPRYSPSGSAFEWTKMINVLQGYSPSDQISAVATLCRAPGTVMYCNYGCGVTLAYLWIGLWPPFTESMEDNYRDHFEFDVDAGHNKSDFSDDEWWNGIVGELNLKQPVNYDMNLQIPGSNQVEHTFVVDGWEVVSGSRMVHVNYGWGETALWSNGQPFTVLGWVLLDNLSFSKGSESRLFNVVPANHIGPSVAGSYTGTLYFNQRASGANATFQPGSWLQFLPTVTVSNNGGPADAITYRGSAASPTLLLANGDPGRGVLIRNGALKLAGRGCVRLVPQVPPRYPSAQRQGPFVRVTWDRGYSDDQTTVIERSNGGAWAVVGTVDASVTYYDDYAAQGSPRYRLRSSAGGGLSVPSDEALAQ